MAQKRQAELTKSKRSDNAFTKLLPWVLIAVAVIAIGMLLFRPATSGPGGGVRKVDSAGLVSAQKAGAQVIDVRTAGEFDLGHIPGAINVPVDQIQQAASGWDRNGSYVVYCASGTRSAQAQGVLQSMGFRNVADLTGGIASWAGQLEKGSASSARTIPTSGKAVFIEFYTPT